MSKFKLILDAATQRVINLSRFLDVLPFAFFFNLFQSFFFSFLFFKLLRFSDDILSLCFLRGFGLIWLLCFVLCCLLLYFEFWAWMNDPMGKKNRVRVSREGGGRRRTVVFCIFFFSLNCIFIVLEFLYFSFPFLSDFSALFFYCTQLHICVRVWWYWCVSVGLNFIVISHRRLVENTFILLDREVHIFFFFIYVYQIIFTLFLLTFGSIPFGSNVEFLMIKWKPCLHIQSYCARRIWKTVLEEEVLRIWGSLGFGSMKEFFLPCLEDLSLLTLGTIWRLVSELSVFFNEFLLLLNVYEL